MYKFPKFECIVYTSLIFQISEIKVYMVFYRGLGQCIQYSDPLQDGRSGDRILVGARFSTPIHTGPEATQPPIQWVPGLSRG
jgi:hypothetical protein